MRIGHWDIPGAYLVMPAFALIAGLLLLWSWYYHARQTRQMTALATSHGWSFLGKDATALRATLAGMATDYFRDCSPYNNILVESSSNRISLFNYQARGRKTIGRGGRSTTSSELGAACLVEFPTARPGGLVTIDHRPLLALLEGLYDDKVEVGGPEFRRAFLVASSQPELAEAAVNSRVEEVLLARASGLLWHRIYISGGGILVTVTAPLKPEDWDELLALSKELLAALSTTSAEDASELP